MIESRAIVEKREDQISTPLIVFSSVNIEFGYKLVQGFAKYCLHLL